MSTEVGGPQENSRELLSDAEYDAAYAEIFGQFDANYTLYESGKRSDLSSVSVAFDEKSGACYIAFNQSKLDGDSPSSGRVMFGMNLRNGRLFQSVYDSISNRKLDENVVLPVLQEILASVPKESIPNLSEFVEHPPGFPELEKVFQHIEKTAPTSVGAIADGSTVIIEYTDKFAVIRVKDIEELKVRGDPWVLYLVEDDGDIVAVDGTTHMVKPHEVNTVDNEHNERVKIALSHPAYSLNPYLRARVWQLEPGQFESFSRYLLKDVDPSLDYPLTREEFIMTKTLDGMAYERWGESQEKIKEARHDRYERVTDENFAAALDALVVRYGIDQFVNSCKWVISSHLQGTHFPSSRANQWGDTHSDISGFDESLLELASAAVRRMHPVVADFGESGRVGYGVYNVKPLFADLGFWKFLSEKYPTSAVEVTQYIFSLGEVMQSKHYDNARFVPKEMIASEFPEVWEVMNSLTLVQ